MQRRAYQAIHQKFLKNQKQIRPGPVQYRRCRDVCCLLTFFLLMGAFVAIGIYYLVVANQALKNEFNNLAFVAQPLTVVKQLFVKYWPVIIGMFGLSFILALAYLFLMRHCARCMVYAMIIVAILVMLGIIGISIVSQAWGTLIATGISLIIFVCMLFCYRSAISRGIVLLKLANQFLKDRPSVFVIPFLVLFLMLLFLAFWIITLVCMQYNTSVAIFTNLSYAKQIVFYIFWIFMLIFFTLFLYYVMVFLIGYTCANWYYGHVRTGCCRGYSLMNSAHIGSLTFASLLITVVKLLQILGSSAYKNQSANGNCCVTCCLCCCTCCLGLFNYIIEFLNKYAVIVMSLTGEGYIQSAKTAMSIISRDFPLFYVTNVFSDLIKYCGVLFAAGVPTLIGYLLIHAIYIRNNSTKYSTNSYEMTSLILLIFFICLVISIFFVSVVSISLSAVFVFFCLDKRYREIGVTVQNTPLTLRRIENHPKFSSYYPEPIVPGSATRFN